MWTSCVKDAFGAFFFLFFLLLLLLLLCFAVLTCFCFQFFCGLHVRVRADRTPAAGNDTGRARVSVGERRERAPCRRVRLLVLRLLYSVIDLFLVYSAFFLYDMYVINLFLV